MIERVKNFFRRLYLPVISEFDFPTYKPTAEEIFKCEEIERLFQIWKKENKEMLDRCSRERDESDKELGLGKYYKYD